MDRLQFLGIDHLNQQPYTMNKKNNYRLKFSICLKHPGYYRELLLYLSEYLMILLGDQMRTLYKQKHIMMKAAIADKLIKINSLMDMAHITI